LYCMYVKSPILSGWLTDRAMSRDLVYERENAAWEPCSESLGIKCRNHEVCHAVLPEWWYECKESYLCTNCHMSFGTWGETHFGKGELEFRDDIECVICMDTKRGVSQPRCNHFVCAECFRRCYYGPEGEPQPDFPYPETEEEYYDSLDESSRGVEEWVTQYPLIAVWIRDMEEWEERRSDRCRRETNLACCPLCRI